MPLKFSDERILERLTGKTVVDIARELGMSDRYLRNRLHKLMNEGKAFCESGAGPDRSRGRMALVWFDARRPDS